MDYNISIPDIYNYKNKNNDDDMKFELIQKQYKIKSDKCEFIDLPQNTLYMIVRFDNNNIYYEGNKIWNNQLIFQSKNRSLHSKIIYNYSDTDVIIDIDIIKSNNAMSMFTPVLQIYKKSIYIIDIYSHITLVNFYSGVRFTDRIYITTPDKITENIIKLQSFNIIFFFKVKLISQNNNYSYELKLSNIKNTFSDEILDVNLNYENHYDIYKIYLETLKNIKIFMRKNIKYIIDNNIQTPENLKDPDGWKENMFYILHPQKFINKYNILTYHAYSIYK
jgi:hypothetical protein